jgi:hypothetical protein
MEKLYAELGLGENDGLFFAAGKADQAAKLAGAARTRVGEQLGLIEEGRYACAGSSTSRSTNGTKTPRRSNSATTRSPCRRAGWRR